MQFKTLIAVAATTLLVGHTSAAVLEEKQTLICTAAVGQPCGALTVTLLGIGPEEVGLGCPGTLSCINACALAPPPILNSILGGILNIGLSVGVSASCNRGKHDY